MIIIYLIIAFKKGEKSSRNLLLVLPAGKAAHIEAGITYALEKNVIQ